MALKECRPCCVTFNKVIQLGMDGPTINRKLFNLVQDEMSETPYKLFNIGSYDIHVVHSFQNRIQEMFLGRAEVSASLLLHF